MTDFAELRRILADRSIDESGEGPSRSELIEALIPRHGWSDVYDALSAVLAAGTDRDQCSVALQVLWGAACDAREMPVTRTIALVVHNFDVTGDDENNLAWSVVARLKGVSYLSEYDPRSDPEVHRELAALDTGSDAIGEATLERARRWLIEERVGLIDRAGLVARVDASIATSSEPPPALVALSVGESLAWSGRLDLVEHPMDDQDAARLASLLLSKLDAGELGWDQVEGSAVLAAGLMPAATRAHGRFAALADSLFVARETGGGPAGLPDARSRLEQIAGNS